MKDSITIKHIPNGLNDPYQHYEYEREWEMKEGFEIILDDDKDGEVRFTTAWTNPARQFLNSLAWYTGKTIWKMCLTTSAAMFNDKMRPSLRLNIDWQNGTPLLNKEAKQQYITPIVNPDTWKITGNSYIRFEKFLETQYDQINAKSQNLMTILEQPVKERTLEEVRAAVEVDKTPETEELPF